jgi:D-glycero-alpha-D-manno-heptose-7-phosphate kinase
MIVRSKAPLRLGLAGGGTDIEAYSDVYGGCVLNATISMYASCTISLRDDKKISFEANDIQEIFQEELSPQYPADGKLILHKGVYNRIIKEFNRNIPIPLTISTFSDAPPGSGLGSSSTLVVALVKAFEELLNLPLGEYDVARLAYEIERKDLGLAGGKQDQYAATFGGFNFIEFHQGDRVIVNPLRIKNWIVDELESSLVLFNSGTVRSSAGVIQDQVNQIKKDDKNALEGFHELKEDAILMKEHILKGNITEFAMAMGRSWEAKKRTSDGITNSRLNQIYDAAIRSGAYAGKISGAGGGGFMMFLCDPVKRPEVIRALSHYEGQVIRTHFINEGTRGWKIY